MIASQNGHIGVVDKLVQHGAAVDLKMEVIEFLSIYDIHIIIYVSY